MIRSSLIAAAFVIAAPVSAQAEPQYRPLENSDAPFSAWTAIGIDRLFTPDGLVEIKVVARLTPKAN